jgi:hypothetical protein
MINTFRRLITVVSKSVCLVTALTAVSPVAEAQLQASDGTFNNNDWVSQIIRPNIISSPVATLTIPGQTCSVGQFTTNGKPSPSRQSCTYYPHPPSPQPMAIWVAHIYRPFTYDPSTQGPIASVSFSYDLRSSLTNATHSLLIVQGNRFYRSVNDPQAPNDTPLISPNPLLWKNIIHVGFTAEEFQEVSHVGSTNHPDFCRGGPMRFGYVTGTSSGNYWSITFLDNWKITLNKPCPCP